MAAGGPSIAPLVDRERELEEIRRFHEHRAAGSAALLIRGEPGSGRTALLDAATAVEGLVLRSRPHPEEATQPFAALRDLLGPVHVAFAPALASPLRATLDAALLRERGAGAEAEAALLPPAVAAALATLGERGPVLLTIDDVQWIDADSLRALRFAVNRLSPPVSIAVVHGDAIDPVLLLGIDRSVPSSRTTRIAAGPLTVAGVHHLLASTLGPPPRWLVNRVAAASGGNPRAAIELARAAIDSDDRAGAGRLPDAVTELVERRLGRLSSAAERVAQLVAVAGRLPVRDLDALLGPESATALEEAETTGAVIERDGELRLSGVLVGTVVLGRATPAAVRAAHAQLATIVDAPDDRARHLAGLPEAADHVGDIEDGATFAFRHGAVSAAANLFAVAARLTPLHLGADHARRLRGQALSLLGAGDPTSARDAAEQAILAAPPGERPRMIADLVDLAWADGSIAGEARRVRDALAEAGDDAVRLDLTTALVAFGVADDPRRALRDADAALQLVDRTGDPGRTGYLLIHREMAAALSGHGIDWDRLREGIRLEGDGLGPGRAPSSPPLVLYTMCDRPDEARARYAVEDAWYAARGEDGWRAERAGQRALVELRAGNTVLARQLADDACDRLDRLQVGGGWPLVYVWRSLVDAHTGRAGRAVETTARLLEELDGATLWAAIARSVAIMASHANGDDASALAHAARMREALDILGVAELLADRSEPLLAELRVAAGDTAGAEQELRRLERRHASLPRPWTTAALVRTTAVVLAAGGDLEGAIAATSSTDAAATTLPFESAWNGLARGRLLRRVRDKRKAAAVLGEARATFDRLGATPWVASADAEIARIGLRRRPAGELTEGELAIARLAAQGLTSREIAAAAFVSPKTVEANLGRIYRKLDIRSRAEVGAWIHEREGTDREGARRGGARREGSRPQT